MSNPTLSQVETEATALSTLISSLSGQTGQAAVNIRSQIQTAAVQLRNDLKFLVNASAESAQQAAGVTFDGLLTWLASTDAYLREKCIFAATSCQGLNQLVQALVQWPGVTTTTNWTTQPEVAAQSLITWLGMYRSLTGQ